MMRLELLLRIKTSREKDGKKRMKKKNGVIKTREVEEKKAAV